MRPCGGQSGRLTVQARIDETWIDRLRKMHAWVAKHRMVEVAIQEIDGCPRGRHWHAPANRRARSLPPVAVTVH